MEFGLWLFCQNSATLPFLTVSGEDNAESGCISEACFSVSPHTRGRISALVKCLDGQTVVNWVSC